MNILDGKLCGMRAFISGPIDRVVDDGVVWRNNIKKLCKDRDIPIIFLDPCDKPEALGQEIGEEKHRMEKLKGLGKEAWIEAQKEVKKFKRIDYRMVDMCDIYIVYIDINIHMCGSYFEFKVAEEERKPILAILSEGMKKADLPTWLVDLVNYDEIFLKVEECVDYLEQINKGTICFDDRLIKVD